MPLKNPNSKSFYEKEDEKRPTISKTARRIFVTPRSALKWFTKGVMPRNIYIGMLASHLNATHDEVRAMFKRCHDITNAGYTLPFGIMVGKDMLINSHKRFLDGKHPFPQNESIRDIGHIEYD